MEKKNSKKIILAPIFILAGGCLVAGIVLGVRTISNIHEASLSLGHSNLGVEARSTSTPQTFIIGKLKISAPFEKLDLNSNGSLQVPFNPNNAGWFIGSSVPGDPGNSVVVGHLDSTFGPALFWHLNNLQLGDQISITRTDGKTATYAVQSKNNYSQDNFPDQQVFGQTSSSILTLITCSGTYSRTVGHYSQNLVVVANLKSLQ